MAVQLLIDDFYGNDYAIVEDNNHKETTIINLSEDSSVNFLGRLSHFEYILESIDQQIYVAQANHQNKYFDILFDKINGCIIVFHCGVIYKYDKSLVVMWKFKIECKYRPIRVYSSFIKDHQYIMINYAPDNDRRNDVTYIYDGDKLLNRICAVSVLYVLEKLHYLPHYILPLLNEKNVEVYFNINTLKTVYEILVKKTNHHNLMLNRGKIVLKKKSVSDNVCNQCNELMAERIVLVPCGHINICATCLFGGCCPTCAVAVEKTVSIKL